VSTPEERLKKQAAELMKHRPETPTQSDAREQQEIGQTAQRLRTVGQAYLVRVMDMITATRMQIYHELHYAIPGTRPGFVLHVGHFALVQAAMQGEGWEVRTRSRTTEGLPNYSYPSDEAVMQARDMLLEPLVASAMQALASGLEQPAPDAYGR
jgi:hypothetical protein